MENDLFEPITKKVNLASEKMLLDDIIFIYEHPFISYDYYIKTIQRYNNEIIKKNRTLEPGKFTTSYIYYPQRFILSKDLFNYVKEIGNKKNT